MLTLADQKGISPFDVAVMAANGTGGVSTTAAQKANLKTFVKTIRDLRTMADEVRSSVVCLPASS